MVCSFFVSFNNYLNVATHLFDELVVKSLQRKDNGKNEMLF